MRLPFEAFDFADAALAPERLERLGRLDPTTLPPLPEGVRLGAPVGRVEKAVTAAMNYRDLAETAGIEAPAVPAIVSRATSSLHEPNDDIILPEQATMADWEVELGVVIGVRTKSVAEDEALARVAG